MDLHAEHDKAILVEEMSHLLEQFRNFPRMAGRMFAVLMLTEKEQLSADELAEMLHASRGSVSSMTRMLIQLGLVRRVSLRGDRRTYYQVADPTVMLENGMHAVRHFRGLMEKALDLTENEDELAVRRLERFHYMYVFFEEEYAAILTRWNEVKKQL